MSRILTITAIVTLMLSAPTLADTVPAGATVWQTKPTGAGKPDAISCYQDVPIGSHIRTMRCARNSEWAGANAVLAPVDQGRPTSTYVQGGPVNQ